MDRDKLAVENSNLDAQLRVALAEKEENLLKAIDWENFHYRIEEK